jgi:hypothetical protein
MNMKTRQSRRQTAKVSHSRWVAYATAGAATALTASHSAEAAIHYQVVNEKFPPYLNEKKWFQLDQPGDSIEFLHSGVPRRPRLGGSFTYPAAGFNVRGIATAAFRGYYGFRSSYHAVFASKLSFGESIAAGHFTHGCCFPFYSAGILAAGTGLGYGPWKNPGMGFVGFAFNNGAGPQFGWVRVRISRQIQAGGLAGFAFKVFDFAYGDPGERITAGQRASEDDQDISDDQGPDEGSLGGLALGAVGLLAWRKSRSRIARSEGA